MISKNKKADEQETFKGVTVKRAHDWGNGNITFDAMFDKIVTVYGMKYIEREKDGTDISFISFPQKKGKDGNYYNHVWFRISEYLQTSIEQQLKDLLDKEQ